MSDKQDERAEIEEAEKRLEGFIKRPVNYHDTEKMRRIKEGREHEPHGVGWRELGRRFRTM